VSSEQRTPDVTPSRTNFIIPASLPDPPNLLLLKTLAQAEQAFARELGADWAGDFEDEAPEVIDSIIDTTPVWKPIVEGLKNLKPGGRLVINAIRKEETDKAYPLKIDYPRHLWPEKEIKSVANVTRDDIGRFNKLILNCSVY
jgi:D-arabinose 1-dehydrogenase-like Zn-dependent alcohol dehydrogenase